MPFPRLLASRVRTPTVQDLRLAAAAKAPQGTQMAAESTLASSALGQGPEAVTLSVAPWLPEKVGKGVWPEDDPEDTWRPTGALPSGGRSSQWLWHVSLHPGASPLDSSGHHSGVWPGTQQGP